MTSSSRNTSSLSEADRTIAERSTITWTGTLRDQDGAVIAAASMTTVTATVTDARTGTKLVDARNVLNVNNGTLSAGGVQTIVLAGADNRIVQRTVERELHRLTIDYTWASGARRHWHVVELIVLNHPEIN